MNTARNSLWPLAAGFWLVKSMLFGVLMLMLSCKPDLTDDAIPFVPFPDIFINLNSPEYSHLNFEKWVYVNDINDNTINGIILYKLNSTTYLAYDRTCSYHPLNNVVAVVFVDSSDSFMIDHSCNSSFDFEEGTPTGGPAWRPLRRYKTYLDGTTLTITDEVMPD